MERMGTGKEENSKIGKDFWICGADAFDNQKKVEDKIEYKIRI
jgi:hypothetical protein